MVACQRRMMLLAPWWGRRMLPATGSYPGLPPRAATEAAIALAVFPDVHDRPMSGVLLDRVARADIVIVALDRDRS